MSTTGPAPAASLDPYRRVEAETIAWARDLKTKPVGDRAGNMALCDITEDAHVLVREVNFGERPARAISLTLSTHQAGATVELRLDRLDGPMLATVSVPDTRGEWRTMKAAVDGAIGVRDVVFVFKGINAGLAMDWWTFAR